MITTIDCLIEIVLYLCIYGSEWYWSVIFFFLPLLSIFGNKATLLSMNQWAGGESFRQMW